MGRSGTEAYSRLSVKVDYHCDAQILETVPPSSFWPSPEVDSAIVQLDARPPPFRVNRERFFVIVDALFSHRRKKSVNALLDSWRKLALPKERLRETLMDTPLAAKRAQEMTPEEMAELTRLLFSPKG